MIHFRIQQKIQEHFCTSIEFKKSWFLREKQKSIGKKNRFKKRRTNQTQ